MNVFIGNLFQFLFKLVYLLPSLTNDDPRTCRGDGGRDRGDKDPQQSKAGTVFGLEELMATDTV